MSDDIAVKTAPAAATPAAGRSGRTQVLAFVTDADTEAVLRLGLVATAEDVVVQRGDSRSAINAMSRMPSPRVLVVDISGEEQPMSALAALSEVVEPDVKVLVVGDRQNVDLYRQLTRTLGVGEYLYKPLNADVVAQHFGPFIAPASVAATQVHGGRILAITGVCGGAGVTTLAANLAWHLSTEAKRHTVLLDANLYTGSAAMLLGAKTGGGLRLALETPDRVDELFMERIAQPAADRLAVVAGEEKLTERMTIASGAVQPLLRGLRQRYNYIVADVPLGPVGWHNELLDQARQRVLVMEPTLQALRDALRIMALPTGAQQVRQSVIVLNKVGAPGTMTRRQVEAALQHKVDVVIPYLPRVVNQAATMGTPAAASHGGFRTGIGDLAQQVAASGAVGKAPWRFGKLFGRRSKG
ncbi:AAA family ATPase [Rhodopila sp.]|uniref:AAA family ATPase n=1 Tax=Rhodopila sp. TaxID=2480087 RepID=UPI003D0A2480